MDMQLPITINATVTVQINQELSAEDFAVLLNVLARLKLLAQKAKVLAAKY